MFTEIIEDLYKKISEEVLDEDLVYENVSPSSNSDSGIFKDSAGGTAAAVAGAGAIGGCVAPDLSVASLAEDFNNAEESFNTERLEHQNSAGKNLFKFQFHEFFLQVILKSPGQKMTIFF